MRMMEFINTYCADIKALYKERSRLLDDYDLPYDDEIEDDAGQLMKVVYAGTKVIPIADIITSTREDFARMYPSFECRDLYDKYVAALIMFEGEDALTHIRGSMQREQERVKAFNADSELSDMV